MKQPVYENNKPYPDTIGYYLCHQPQCHGDGCGDMPGVWRLYRIDCGRPHSVVTKRRGPGLPRPLRGLEKAREALRKAIEENNLTLVMHEQPDGDWPLAQYASLEEVFVPENPPDPATRCPSKNCKYAVAAHDEQEAK